MTSFLNSKWKTCLVTTPSTFNVVAYLLMSTNYFYVMYITVDSITQLQLFILLEYMHACTYCVRDPSKNSLQR